MATNTGSHASISTYSPYLPSYSASIPGDTEALKYDDHHIMMATITTTSEADVDALDLPELQEAVVAAVAELQGASEDKDSIIVSTEVYRVILGWRILLCPI